MAYSKQTFVAGQTLTAAHMNHIEQGIYDASVGSGGDVDAGFVTKSLSWISPYATNEQDGLTYDPIEMTFTGVKVPYSNKAIALPLTDDAEWTLTINLASYSAGQIISLNALGLYNKLYIGTNATRKDVRFGFAFDYTDVANKTGTKYYNFTWSNLSETLTSGAHSLSFIYSNGKMKLSIDNGVPKAIDSFCIGTSAEIELDDSDGVATKTLVELIQAHTGSKQVVFNGGGYTAESGLSFNGSFKLVGATVKAHSKDVYEGAPAQSLMGKNIQFLGSSIFYGTTGQPKGFSFVDILNKRWGTSFQKEAVGGTTLAIREGVTTSYCERYENFTNKETCDALVIQLSTNDFTLGVPVGSIDENAFGIESFNNQTICGAIEWLIAKGKQNNPDVKVVFVSCPMLDSWEHYESYKSFNNGLMRDIAAKWDIDVVDLFNDTLPWSNSSVYWAESTANPTSTTYHLFYNNIHMNCVGYPLVMTPKIASKLLDIFAD